MPYRTIDPAQRARALASNERWRWIFAALALLIPLALFAAFRRQEHRLTALADHGRNATAFVTRASRDITWYHYDVDGRTYEWNVARRQLPLEPGASATVSYLPEDPALSRPIANYSMRDFEAEVSRPFKRALLTGFFLFFTLFAVLCQRAVRRLRAPDYVPRVGPLLSPRATGLVLAGLFYAIFLGVELDPAVRAVQAKAFGAAPFGIPVVVVVLVADAILFAPLFVMMPALMTLAFRAQAFSRGQIVAAVANAPATLRREKRIVIGCALWFLALFAGWIAFAAYRGI